MITHDIQSVTAEMLFGKEVKRYPILLDAFRTITAGVGRADLREELSKVGDIETVIKVVLASMANPNQAHEWLEIWKESFKTECKLKYEVPGYILGLTLGIFKAANRLINLCNTPDFHKLMSEIIKDIILCQRDTVLRINEFWNSLVEYKHDLSKEIKDYIKFSFMPRQLDISIAFKYGLMASLSKISDCLVKEGTLPMIKGDPPILLSGLGALVFEQIRYALFAQMNPSLQLESISSSLFDI